MVDKMMRMAGRGADTTAKAISVSNTGSVRTLNSVEELLNRLASNTTVPKGTTKSFGEFRIDGLDEIYISSSTGNWTGYRIIVEEILVGLGAPPKVLKTHTSDPFSGAAEFTAKKIESHYARISVQNISTTEDLTIGLFAVARKSKAAGVSNTGSVRTLNSVEELSNRLASNISVPNGETVSFGQFRIDGLDEVYINSSTGNWTGYKIIVEEILVGLGNVPKVLETHTSKVLSGVGEFTAQGIKSHYIRISVQNISTSGEALKIGLFAVARKSNKVDIEEPIDKLISSVTKLMSNTVNKLPKQPVVSNVKIKSTDVNFVQDFQDGLFYGTKGVNIFTSPDGETWTKVASSPWAEINRSIIHLFKTDSGRFVACAYGGDVFISDENGVFDDTPSFSTGKFSHNFGTTRYANIIGFTTYEPAGFDDGQKHEAWLSVDNGATFKKIFDNSVLTDPKFPPLTDTRTHLHDIEYDPMSGRIYIWAGDFDAQTLYYSDTMGDSWDIFGGQRKIAGNATQLIAGPFGLALGADTYGGGVGFIHIDRTTEMNYMPTLSDLDDNHWVKRDLTKRFLSTKKWVDRENSVYLIPAIPEYDEDGRRGYIAYSENGRDWMTIWESPHSESVVGLESIVYGNGKLVGCYNDQTGTGDRRIFTADLKIFDK